MMVKNYTQMPLQMFLAIYPEFKQMFPPHIFNDPRYVVRFRPGDERVEVGFPGDAWQIR